MYYLSFSISLISYHYQLVRRPSVLLADGVMMSKEVSSHSRSSRLVGWKSAGKATSRLRLRLLTENNGFPVSEQLFLFCPYWNPLALFLIALECSSLHLDASLVYGQ